jgi:adenylosuccinate synthase
VIVVLKAFMTRVGAGPFPGELSREEAIKRGWFETAAGTGRERRSAPFSLDLAKKAIMINSATQIALTKLDCLHPECKGQKNYKKLSPKAKDFIEQIEKQTGAPVTLIGTGPEALDIIDRRE